MITSIDGANNVLRLEHAAGGDPPAFDSEPGMMRARIRQEMRRVYENKDVPVYANKLAKTHIEEGVKSFHRMELDKKQIIFIGGDAYIFGWVDDVAVNTLALALKTQGLKSSFEDGIVIVTATKRVEIETALRRLHGQVADEDARELLTAAILAGVDSKEVNKHDHLLPAELKDAAYRERYLDMAGLEELLKELL